MPLNYAGNWEDVGNAFNNLGGSMSGIAVGLAQQRFQQEQARQNMMLHMMQLQQQQQLYKAHEGLYGAQTSEATARAGEANAHAAYLNQKTSEALAGVRSGDRLADTIRDIVVNPNAPENTGRRGDALGEAARLMAGGNAHAAQSVNQLLSAAGGNTPMGDIIGLGSADKAFVNVPQGAVAFNPTRGTSMLGANKLRPGEQLYAPQPNLGEAVPGGAVAPVALPPPIATNTTIRPFGDTPEGKDYGRTMSYIEAVRRGGLTPDVGEDPLYDLSVASALDYLKQRKGGAPSGAQPLPTDKTKLVKGQRYSTSRGEATWDGTQFVK